MRPQTLQKEKTQRLLVQREPMLHKKTLKTLRTLFTIQFLLKIEATQIGVSTQDILQVILWNSMETKKALTDQYFLKDRKALYKAQNSLILGQLSSDIKMIILIQVQVRAVVLCSLNSMASGRLQLFIMVTTISKQISTLHQLLQKKYQLTF